MSKHYQDSTLKVTHHDKKFGTWDGSEHLQMGYAVSDGLAAVRPNVKATPWGGTEMVFLVDDNGRFDPKGDHIVTEYWFRGFLHRPYGQPAYVCSRTGTQAWYEFGQLHRDRDEPALVYVLKGDLVCEYWHQEGKRHRAKGKPAIIWREPDSKKFVRREWWVDGKCHRDGDEPAVHALNGKAWYKDGGKHRDNDEPACIIYKPPSKDPDRKEWFVNGKQHRENDKPAYIDDKSARWYHQGSKHRATGPAVVSKSWRGFHGEAIVEFYVFGKPYTISALREEARNKYPNIQRAGAYLALEMDYGLAPGTLASAWKGNVSIQLDVTAGEVTLRYSGDVANRIKELA